jgi:hypothetical protein|tara:strand:- start:3679 stop:3843 length:165 start_codon:yes stop_codon:yes gene_type:complete
MKYKNQIRYSNRNIEKGLVRTTVWCPKQLTKELKAKALELRVIHENQQRGEANQ